MRYSTIVSSWVFKFSGDSALSAALLPCHFGGVASLARCFAEAVEAGEESINGVLRIVRFWRDTCTWLKSQRRLKVLT